MNANISTAAQSSFATTSLLPDPSRHGIAFSICCHVIYFSFIHFINKRVPDANDLVGYVVVA